MKRLNPPNLLDLGDVRQRLDRWRRRRQRGERIPASLWAEAEALARAHGVSLVARTLGLDYLGLKRRAQAALPERPTAGGPPPGFVEVPLLGALAPAVSGTVELVRGDGARMMIGWAGQSSPDLVGLAEAFWRAGR
jgi:hypothetical protein